MMRANDIHAALAGRWPTVLEQLGVDAAALRNKHGPCPVCGGKDRFRFDDRRGRGDYYCNGCGPGDGFALLQRLHGWTFAQTAKAVREAAGLNNEADSTRLTAPTPRLQRAERELPAQPTPRVHSTLRDSCPIEASEPASLYLTSRGLLPLPRGHMLRAHAGLDYWHDLKRIGKHAALVARIANVLGETVSVHVTYLTDDGRKLAEQEPRKIISKLTGHDGCAARLMPLAGPVLGIAEGIETALSATAIHGVPVWAALNASLLSKYVPPSEVHALTVFADRDVAGLEAAAALVVRLQGQLKVDLRVPRAPFKDWNDVLLAQITQSKSERDREQ